MRRNDDAISLKRENEEKKEALREFRRLAEQQRKNQSNEDLYKKAKEPTSVPTKQNVEESLR